MCMLKRGLFGALAISVLAMYLFMSLTNPSTAHPLVLLFFFLILYVVFLLIFMIVIVYGGDLLSLLRISKVKLGKKSSLSQAYIHASVLALAPVMLVAINSVGALNLRTVVLVVIFEMLLFFYVKRRS